MITGETSCHAITFRRSGIFTQNLNRMCCRCCAPLSELPEEKVRAILLGAAQFRLQRKAAHLARVAEAHGADEALYQALAGTAGQ